METAKRTLACAWVGRDLLLFDPDGTVRAAAARLLGRCGEAAFAPALRDALYDELPLVRHASIVALARLRDAAAVPQLIRHASEDPIWWVRRAALFALTQLAPDESIPPLRNALDDPFWRVRHAAVQALLSLAEPGMDEAALLAQVGHPGSDRAEGAVAYLRKRLGVDSASSSTLSPAPAEAGPPADPDPAVVTARLERGDAASLAFLVECLGDPHERLRRAASGRLREHADSRALRMCLLWLEEPRIPHAAQAVFALLNGVRAELLLETVVHALADVSPGATCWALSTVGERGERGQLARVIELASHDSALIRRAAIAALGQLSGVGRDPGHILEVLRGARRDHDVEVARLAARALAGSRVPGGKETLASEPPDRDHLVRRLQVQAAVALRQPARLRLALRDADAMGRAEAVSWLSSNGQLTLQELAGLEDDPDPWIRMAVLRPETAERRLASDPFPPLRRAAFTQMLDRPRAALLATAASDPWLRARSAAGLDPGSPDGLRQLLILTRDPSRAVRSAAAETLGRQADLDGATLDQRLDVLLSIESSPDIRIAAYGVRLRRFDPAALDRLRTALTTETLEVSSWLEEVLHGWTGEVRPLPSLETSTMVRRKAPPRRRLGRTDVDVSPLAVSGVGDLSEPSFRLALDAGCDLFFWEPRYRSLSRFLRSTRPGDASVIAGTFHASATAIVTDVDRALRRLRRETLDVFLLFWARSAARFSDESCETLARLRTQGKIRAAGFSTHDRTLAGDAIRSGAFDVAMIRHSAAHPGAEEHVLPLAQEHRVGVLTFSALAYGRLLGPTVTAVDAYAYSLAQPGVSAVISAPRSRAELRENLAVLRAPALSPEAIAALRSRGQQVRAETRDFNNLLRRFPLLPHDTDAAWCDDAASEDLSASVRE